VIEWRNPRRSYLFQPSQDLRSIAELVINDRLRYWGVSSPASLDFPSVIGHLSIISLAVLRCHHTCARPARIRSACLRGPSAWLCSQQPISVPCGAFTRPAGAMSRHTPRTRDYCHGDFRNCYVRGRKAPLWRGVLVAGRRGAIVAFCAIAPGQRSSRWADSREVGHHFRGQGL